MRRQGMISAAAVLCTVFIAAAPFVSLAVEGWDQEQGEWVYRDQDDRPVTNTWRLSKEEWYYLDAGGRILQNSIFHTGAGIYYVDADGKRARSTWIWIDAESCPGTMFEEGWYYFGADGRAYTSRGGFLKKIDGSTYAFNGDGRLLTGWLDESGIPLDDVENPFMEGMYYSREDGALLTGEWLDYGHEEDKTGGADQQSMLTGKPYSDYDRMWIYFDEKSRKVRSRGSQLKKKTIGGDTYGFDENGVMNPWWSRVASVSSADRSNPTVSEPARFYAGYDGGRLLKNEWFWMYPSENLDAEDYSGQECSWWYADEKGDVIANRLRKIRGKRYAFDGIGRMRTGFVLFDGKTEFVAQYDMDDWSSEDFIDGNLYGLEKADLYFFSADEWNDGSMQTGKALQIQLADGLYTFGFSDSGKAYGNRNKLQKKDDVYYINGLRLEADPEYGYGVVMVEHGGKTSYQVVDGSGKAVKGRRRIVKDHCGGYLMILNNRFVAWSGDENRPRWKDGGFYLCDEADRDGGTLIAGGGLEPSADGLPEEQRLNFD